MFLRVSRSPAFSAAVALLIGVAPAFGFVFTGVSWPFGTSIQMQLSLGATSAYLQDGSGTWNNSAATAGELWNQQLQGVKFSGAQTSATNGYQGDGVNTVWFSNTIYGDSFGANTLAVTVWYYSTAAPSVTTETDVIFNRAMQFNSYRGPIQVAPGGRDWLYDFQRVALHEFGHALGLDHPDQSGQTVAAIMNSIISDLDHLVDDDIAGGKALYGFVINSYLFPPAVVAGSDFRYQITTDRGGASFNAAGLPAGLQIDSGTGVITGKPTAPGTYNVLLTATIGAASTSATLKIVVTAPAITSPLLVNIEIGNSLSYRITATNSPTLFSASGLPAGLGLNTATGVITGRPTVLGSFPVELTATGSVGAARAKLTLNVVAPRITSSLTIYLQPGLPLQYQITATNHPTSFGAAGLPPGLALNTATGLITGSPTKVGIYRVTLKANGGIANASAIARFEVLAPSITSYSYAGTQVGRTFRYQVTVSTPATSYAASGLPAGLQMNAKTGLISGVATLSGSYSVLVAAQTAFGEAAATLALSIAPAPEVHDKPAASFALAQDHRLLVADPVRSRIYATTSSQLHVIDTVTLSDRIVPLYYQVEDLCLSADGSTLWLVPSNSASLARIDLETLTHLSDLPPLDLDPVSVREGLDHRLYIVGNTGQVVQLDTRTGATTTGVWPSAIPGSVIEISPDRRTLYLAETSGNSTLRVYDISTELPRLLQQTSQYPAQGRLLALDKSGASLALVDIQQSRTPRITIVPVADITKPSKIFDLTDSRMSMTFSPDGANAFIGGISPGVIAIFDTKTWQQVRTLDVGNDVLSEVCDNSASYLFVASDTLRVYRINEPPAVSPPNSLLNVSTRLRTQGSDRRMIGGFIISGGEPKGVAIRAIGPSLNTPGALADPTLEVYDSTGKSIAQNDNWNSTRQALIDAKIAPRDEHDAAMIRTLAPGSYTVVVDGVGQTAGVAVVEVYDLDPTLSSLANISTRGFVGTDDNVMIGGFILGGDQPTRVVVRSIGPSLAASSITGALQDTTLELHDGNGALIAQNDDWRSDQQQEILATGVAPPDNRESAIVGNLTPGGYTAIVRGKNASGTGIGLVEVYNLDLK